MRAKWVVEFRSGRLHAVNEDTMAKETALTWCKKSFNTSYVIKQAHPEEKHNYKCKQCQKLGAWD